ncbi:MAG: peptidylprolyl isomerase [bacterium]
MKTGSLGCVILSAAFIGVLLSCKQQPGADPDTLAVVGERVIDQDDFVKRYQDFRRRVGGGVPDHGEARRQVLQNYIDEELLIAAAIQRGYAEDAAGRLEHKRLEIQELLNAFNRDRIAAKVRVHEAELKQLFVRLNTQVQARHLYAPTRPQADSLFAALQNGASFEALAASTFKDPVLRDSGGLLGYFTVDEMDPSFEEAAFALKIGEISRPVRTIDGYSIIRVEQRVTKPLLTETEYARHRDKLQGYWKKRKAEAAVQAYVDSMRQELNISFNETTVAELFARLQEDARREVFVESPQQARGDDLDNEELVRSTLGAWDVAKFRAAARFTSAKQQNWIRSTESFKDFIAGLVIRSHILAQAKAEKLDRQPGYRDKVAENFDAYLLARMEEALYREMQVPEDSLRRYFEKDPQRYAAPAQVHLREIVVRERALAETLARRLKGGASFAELAKKHSERRRTAEQGGDLGFLTPQDLGRWSDLAFALKPGERRGPVQMDSMFVLLECLAQKPAQPRSFEQARLEVEEAVRQIKRDETRRAFINQIRQSVPVATYVERLNEVRLN